MSFQCVCVCVCKQRVHVVDLKKKIQNGSQNEGRGSFNYIFVCAGVCKSTCQTADSERQHTLELDENCSTFLPAMPLISRIRLREITATPQTSFVPTSASTKSSELLLHIYFMMNR